MKTTIKLNRKGALELIDTIKSMGCSAGVEFIKKDGTLRKMLARFGVKPISPSKTGRTKAYDPKAYGFKTALDVNKTIAERKKSGNSEAQVYRHININTLCCINFGGVRYEVIGNELDRQAYQTLKLRTNG